MIDRPSSVAPFRCALALAAATLLLVGLGGLVTSTHSGLTVPDWPLSYGRLMPRLVGGILFEHGHRAAGDSPGAAFFILTAIGFPEGPRAWMAPDRLEGAPPGLVILQKASPAVLMVLLKLPSRRPSFTPRSRVTSA
ncbi:MAG: COX15/CtaA family protein [Elusimicrobia bacterium]|nr:COX15/CtaA family protein [Elusimicrobiota bacterium]